MGEWQDGMVDESETQDTILADREELNQRKALLAHAWTTLNDRQRHILTERWLNEDPTTLQELARHYGISRERVRQIEVPAFEKLQKHIQVQAIETG